MCDENSLQQEPRGKEGVTLKKLAPVLLALALVAGIGAATPARAAYHMPRITNAQRADMRAFLRKIDATYAACSLDSDGVVSRWRAGDQDYSHYHYEVDILHRDCDPLSGAIMRAPASLAWDAHNGQLNSLLRLHRDGVDTSELLARGLALRDDGRTFESTGFYPENEGWIVKTREELYIQYHLL